MVEVKGISSYLMPCSTGCLTFRYCGLQYLFSLRQFSDTPHEGYRPKMTSCGTSDGVVDHHNDPYNEACSEADVEDPEVDEGVHRRRLGGGWGLT